MKKNGFRILHITAIVVAMIMLISGATFGTSATEKNGSTLENQLISNYARPDSSDEIYVGEIHVGEH